MLKPSFKFSDYAEKLFAILSKVAVTDAQSNPMSVDSGFALWCDWTEKLKSDSATMYFIGNGASATMASHSAADAEKIANFRTRTFNDAALLTSVSNDISYEQSFATPLQRWITSKDVLVSISSSGASPNILEAISEAKAKNAQVVTLTGMSPDNPARKMGDLNFWTPGSTYGFVEAAHQIILHGWLDLFSGATLN